MVALLALLIPAHAAPCTLDDDVTLVMSKGCWPHAVLHGEPDVYTDTEMLYPAEQEVGAQLALTADMDGDGSPEVIIGAPGAGVNLTNAGALIQVPAADFAPWSVLSEGDYPHLYGHASGVGLGKRVEAAGPSPHPCVDADCVWDDLTGDGLSDLMAPIPSNNNLFFYAGSFGGWTDGDVLRESSEAVWTGSAIAGKLGQAAVTCDRDGDGQREIIVANSESPRAECSSSGASGEYGEVFVLSSTPWPEVEQVVCDWPPTVSWWGDHELEHLGNDLSCIDLLGTGEETVLAGTNYDDADSPVPGYVALFPPDAAGGAASEVGAKLLIDGVGSDTPNITITAGDLDGSGLQDLIVGAPGYPCDICGVSKDSCGIVGILYDPGLKGLPADGELIALADELVCSDGGVGDSSLQRGLGRDVVSAGDLNGDGIDDLVIGEFSEAASDAKRDRVHVLYGRSGGFRWSEPRRIDDVADHSFHQSADGGDLRAQYLGQRLALADVNLDGFSDILAGAKRSRGADGEPGRGRAWIIYGGPDLDGDGYFAASVNSLHGRDGVDCNDDDDDAHPGAVDDSCDGVDQDCDGVDGLDCGETDDIDGDGHIDEAAGGDDCDDADAWTYEGAPEVRDDRDNDCDEELDEGTLAWDGDGDGYDPHDGDCDDSDLSVNPGAIEGEPADGVNQDCDVRTDELTLGRDDDRDGYSEDDGDCDDTTPARSPGAAEVCDDIDNDCDGLIDLDDDDLSPWYVDADGDGFGAPDSEPGCPETPGFAPTADDCDDDDSAFNPGAEDTDPHDGNDYNCDGRDEDTYMGGPLSCSAAPSSLPWLALFLTSLLTPRRLRAARDQPAAPPRSH